MQVFVLELGDGVVKGDREVDWQLNNLKFTSSSPSAGFFFNYGINPLPSSQAQNR